ncbi:hypothetical protein HYV86_01400 [Candidatus Woesearchaeota archaeon]|nr:hypothetical protein [Candidatus Woesearchaeota archaeon]
MKDLPSDSSYPSPSIVDSPAYNLQLVDANRIYHHQVGETLCSLLNGSFPEITIVTTGSDGRYEKGLYETSRVELVVLTDEVGNSEEFFRVLTPFFSKHPERIYPDLEIKSLAGGPLSYYQDSSDRIFPTRINDAVTLFGDSKRTELAKCSLYREVVSQGLGTKIYETFSGKRAGFQRVVDEQGSQKFKGEKISNYYVDGESVVSCLSRDKNLLSFKNGPLRFVQYKIMQEAMKFCRSLTPDERDQIIPLLAQAPTNMRSRLKYYNQQGISALSTQETQDLCASYDYFVWAYNLAQQALEEAGQECLAFRKKDVIPRIEDIQRTLKNRTLLKKC